MNSAGTGDRRDPAPPPFDVDALIARDPAHPALPEALRRSAERHAHLCPRQVLGARLTLAGAAALGIPLPQADKRLLAVVESDGCFSDGVAVTANCWVGRRTMRVEDYGRVAVTLVDTHGGAAVRCRPQLDVRTRVGAWAADAATVAAGGRDTGLGMAPMGAAGGIEVGAIAPRWAAYVLGYQRMPDAELVDVLPVTLTIDPAAIISHPDRRAVCAVCGEEVSNGREVVGPAGTTCAACADPAGAYYRLRERGPSSHSA